MAKTTSDLETLIENEKRALVKECFNETWEELADEGLDANLIAEVFVEATLRRLVTERGDEPASRLVAHLKQLDEMGFLPDRRTLQ